MSADIKTEGQPVVRSIELTLTVSPTLHSSPSPSPSTLHPSLFTLTLTLNPSPFTLHPSPLTLALHPSPLIPALTHIKKEGRLVVRSIELLAREPQLAVLDAVDDKVDEQLVGPLSRSLHRLHLLSRRRGHRRLGRLDEHQPLVLRSRGQVDPQPLGAHVPPVALTLIDGRVDGVLAPCALRPARREWWPRGLAVAAVGGGRWQVGRTAFLLSARWEGQPFYQALPRLAPGPISGRPRADLGLPGHSCRLRGRRGTHSSKRM